MTSRLPGLYRFPPDERMRRIAEAVGMEASQLAGLQRHLDLRDADSLVENVVGTLDLPLGIATNFVVNGREVLVPMAIEESSVVAAASHAAKMTLPKGGFRVKSTEPVMIGQIYLTGVPDLAKARSRIDAKKEALMEAAREASGSLVRRGGGPQALEVATIATEQGPVLRIHALVDVRDAMGANIVNSVAEALAPLLAELTGGHALLRILSNLSDHRMVRAEATFDRDALGGEETVRRIMEAVAIADADPYRAATHNKGVMNGVDAVVLATGNDWRAIEAGVHAYAARDGRYRSLTSFTKTFDGDLEGVLEIPLALGIVGGLTKAHPTAAASLRLMGVTTAPDLCAITAAVGLAQNVAALRALVTEGIQQGHMRLHATNLAILAGVPRERVREVADQMVAEGNVRMSRAEEIWRAARRESS
ncbi:MAG: hydroxymethylglutaryl-CoA reductase, degradative [Thermoplasmatota archaeon]